MNPFAVGCTAKSQSNEGKKMTSNYENIFVMYPRGVRTGGPEALHQLVDMLRSLGQPAFLVACSGAEKPRASEYDCYNAPEVPAAVDSPRNAVIVPETYIRELKRFKHATKFCWWLSIDNSPIFESEKLIGRIEPDRARNRLRLAKHFALSAVQSILRSRHRNDCIHLAQSSYAWAYVSSRINTNPSILSDYTCVEEFGTQFRPQLLSRGRTVAYNPAKGRETVEKIIESAPKDIEWRPIQNLSRAGVIALLQDTSIYLDMGHHPGKDRMPREAALAGAVSIVSRRGAGAYYNDVPVPWEHKISIGPIAVEMAVQRIEQVLENVPAEALKQKEYVRRILEEKEQFRREVEDIFLLHRLGKDYADYERMLSSESEPPQGIENID